MLRIRVSELSVQDRNRLSTELAMVLLKELTFPPFMDYRVGEWRTRPYSQADLQRAESFVAGLRLEQQDTIEISSSGLAEQLADMLLSYYRSVIPTRAQRQTMQLQRTVLQLASQVQRRLVAYVLDGANNGFGLTVTPTSWGESRTGMTPPWEAIAPGTISLATALATLREEKAPPPTQVGLVSRPLPPSAANKAPEMVTELLLIVQRAPLPPEPTPMPPPAPQLTAPLPRSVELPPTPQEQRGDQAIFQQLREQLLAAMTNAARNYGVTTPPGDPAGLLAALRQRNAIDESDLRLAEGILALCGKVVAAGRASLEEYRQALMLYLLFHRGHFTRR
jgi:hypothetical protein